MKFFSKYSNHRITLSPGLPGEPLTGRLPRPGIYVKFEDGVADVKDEEIIKMLYASAGFGTTIIAEKTEDSTDPYKNQRKNLEPEHDVINIEYGHVGKNLNPKPKMTLSVEQKNIVMDMAKEMAKQMAPELAKEMLLEMAATRKSETLETKEAEPEVKPLKTVEAIKAKK